MPELPEVETVRRGLERLIVGRRIQSVTSDWPKSFPNSTAEVDKFMKGSKVVAVKRRAKVLIIELDTKYSLVVHLKMTGQLVFRGEQVFGGGHPNDSLVSCLPDKSTRVIITFSDESKLFFNDQRKFGWMRLLPSVNVMEMDLMKKLGPEPLKPDFTAQVFIGSIKRRASTSVKAAILDQTVLAGVGNIYADESLWAAKIHPATLVKNLNDTKLKNLHREIVLVLTLSIDKGGSTDKNYVDAEGQKGSYLKFAKVFRRDGQACPRHPNQIIKKTRVAGRGTHYCSSCQVIITSANKP